MKVKESKYKELENNGWVDTGGYFGEIEVFAILKSNKKVILFDKKNDEVHPLFKSTVG